MIVRIPEPANQHAQVHMQQALIVDREMRIRFVAPEIERATGHQVGSLYGCGLDELFDGVSCELINRWWLDSPVAVSSFSLTLAKTVMYTEPEMKRWSVRPLICPPGSVQFALLSPEEPFIIEERVQRANDQADVSIANGDLELLHEISVLLNSSLEPDSFLQNLSDILLRNLGFAHVSFYMLEEGALVRKTSAGHDTGEAYAVLDVGNRYVGKAIYEGSAIVVNNLKDEKAELKPLDIATGAVALPISELTTLEGVRTTGVIGAVFAISTDKEVIPSDDIRRLEAAANTASMAIENARLMERVLVLLRAEANHSQELEHKKKELDEFVHTISHDLKNPLNNIAGFADLLKVELETSGNEKIERYIERIGANITIVSKMIEDLLELSRVGRVDVEMQHVPMGAFIKELKYDFKAAYKPEDLELNCFNMPEVVPGNRYRLNQLFNNLITNAVKYRHPDRKPMVTVTCVDEDEYYHFSVSDNGIGIDEKHLNSIFVFGIQLREKDAGGTGAGLAIAKKIVESHNGRIWVESEKSEGSTFHFTLPKEINNDTGEQS
jgi:signal transduction histidine kinase